MFYTVGTAAKATGKSKPTITRAIKKGQISAAREEDGSYRIDPAELHRVFPPVTSDGNANGDMTRDETRINNGMLQGTAEVLRELVRQLESERDDLRRRLDDASEGLKQEREERRRITALLTDQRAKSETPRPGFWRRLFDGG
jgi:excisionase family DNA binding protein